MKKLIAGLFLLIVALMGATAYVVYNYLPPGAFGEAVEQATGIKKLDNKSGKYSVFQNGNFIRSFDNSDDAKAFAGGYTRSYVTETGDDAWLWDNYPQFSVFLNGDEYWFDTMAQAADYARSKTGFTIINRANKATIWRESDRLPRSYIIENVPLIAQKPELPRGCEVTSLAMLINYHGIGVSKLDLAEQVKKDETPFSKDKNGNITFGNPRRGFVGDMYDMSKPGLGVYSEPIFELLKSYIGTDAINLTGASFHDLFYFIAKNKPVWVVTNYTFKPLSQDSFQKWKTEDGDIYVTSSMHSVLVKGYDEKYVYFNDPFDDTGMSKAPIADFILAWDQMGRQAVSYFE